MNTLKTKAIILVFCTLILGIAPPAWAGPFDVENKLTASDAALGDLFGVGVAISGDTAIVGARWDDDTGDDSGSAYLFDADPLSPTFGDELFKLTASDAEGNDFFGLSVGVSANTAIVGAFGNDDALNDSGSAYLFDVTTGNQLFKLTASDAAQRDEFGFSVGISGDTAIVGAWANDDACPADFFCESGSAYLFDVTTGNEFAKLTASDAAAGDQFGQSVDISGNTAIVGARFDDDAGSASGSAYLFDADPLSPTFGDELFKLTASDAEEFDLFGFSVGISGGIAIVGAYNNDDAGNASGSAYLFDADPLSPTFGNELLKLTASDAAAGDDFGISVAISGGTAIVGANRNDDAGPFSDSGSAYLFDADPLSPTFGNELLKLTASDAAAGDDFGTSVSVDAGTAIVGAQWDDDAGTLSGSAYLFGVPEPSSFLLALLALVGLVVYGRRRRRA